MEELLNKLKEINAIRAIGDYADYEPDGKHKDTIYFAEDEEKVYLNGKSYGGVNDGDLASLLDDYAKTADIDNLKPVILDDNTIGDVFSSGSSFITEENFNILKEKVTEAFFNKRIFIIKVTAPFSLINYRIHLVTEYILSSPTSLYFALSDGHNYIKIANYNHDANGNIVINRYKPLYNNNIIQTTGTFTNVVMSQKACTDSFVQKQEGKVLSSNDFTNKDKSKLDSLSNYNDSEILEEIQNINNALEDKVSKDGNKQLSTEDFTTLLKEKLEGLENYDDTEIQAKLAQLKANLDTILNDENATAVIDTFQEIEAFLQGITNTETLTGLLQDLKSDILALCNNTYVAKTDYTAQDVLDKIKTVDGDNSGLDADLLDGYQTTTTGEANKIPVLDNTSTILIKNIKFETSKKSINTSGWYRIATTNDNCSSCNILLCINKKWNGKEPVNYLFSIIVARETVITQLNGIYYNNYIPKIRIVHKTALKHYIDVYYNYNNDYLDTWSISDSFIMQEPTLVDEEIPEGYTVNEFETVKGFKSSSPLNADSLIIKQFSENDDLNSFKTPGRYVTNSTAIGNSLLNNPSTVNNGEIIMDVIYNGMSNGWQILLKKSGLSWGYWCRAFTNTAFSSWERMATINSNVASAGKVITKELTNEDLNDILVNTTFYSHYNVYRANTNNTCANKPKNVTGFGLQVFTISLNSTYQILTDYSSTNIYKRRYAGGIWSDWQQLATTDGAVAKLVTKNLVNGDDLNNIKTVEFTFYYIGGGNTVLNKPAGVGNFGLQVYGCSNAERFTQILTTDNNKIYIRQNISNTWTPWKKMLTEDDISSLVSRIEALESKIN